MKKILVAFDSSSFSAGALDYALNLLPRESTLIVGVFIEDLSYLGYVTLFGEDYFAFDTRVLDKMEKEAEGKLDENMRTFEQKCKEASASYKIHLDKGVPANELVRESLFADLIILGYQTFFSSVSGEASILKDVLVDAECPVLVVPEQYKPVQSLVLTFDGKVASVYAIRQFTQLFPAFTKLPASMLHIAKGKEGEDDNSNLMKEYLSINYPNLSIQVATGSADEVIISNAESFMAPLVVMGAYGRSAFSRFFSKSTAAKLLKEKSWPVFAAHK
ncbi:MAG: universal stress protein [Chitinophagales bacterium]|nr:universal stress protein [Chitinophagales bacterium]